MKKKVNEAEYSLSITDLNTTDGDALSQIVAMANQADNTETAEPVEALPVADPYEDGLEGDVAVDTPFDTMEDDPTTDEMGYGVPVEEPEMNAYANPEMDTAVVPVNDMMGDDTTSEFISDEDEVEENDFNEVEPYTDPLPNEENILTEDGAPKGYSVMVKDKEYAHIDTDKEYSDDEIITEFLKQYMAKTGKEFPYIDQIVVKQSNGDVEEDVLLPKDDDNEFIPESWLVEEEDDGYHIEETDLDKELKEIMWASGMKEEDSDVDTHSILENSGSSDTFQNLSDEKVDALYKKYKAQGLSDDEIFDKIYSKDCNLDNEEDLDESENPEMNLKDCDAPNPAEMNLDDKEEIDEANDSEWKTVRKNAMANPNLYGGRYTDKDSRKAKKEFLKDKEANKKKGLKEAGESSKGLRVPVRFEFDGYIDVRTNSEEEAIQLITDNCWAHLGDVATNMREEIANYNINTNGYPRILDDEPIEEVEVDELEESAYSPKLKDPNRKAPTQANYHDVNINADAKSGTLGFEYPAPTNGKITVNKKAGKIMETAKHLLANAEGNKKEKLQSRFIYKLMNEGITYSDAKKIICKF